MKCIIIKNLQTYEFLKVKQLNFVYTPRVDELDMDQMIIFEMIIDNKKSSININSDTIITIVEDKS